MKSKLDGMLDRVALLTKKYDMTLYEYGSYMYNEYPHKSIWSNEFNSEDFRTALKGMSAYKDTPRLLYTHIPFCQKRCFFCICHTMITTDYEGIKDYLRLLFREIDLLRKFFDENSIIPNFKEVHIGGGSPTILREREFKQLIEKIQTIVDMKKVLKFSIEIDPREIDKERLKYYHALGINRLSFGVQDFDLDVQQAINRIQPPELIENLLTHEIRKYFDSINFDILCGLPRQTKDSFRRTIDTVIKLSPDRIMLMFLTYSPDIKRHQKLMDKSEIPNVCERIAFFHDALEALLNNGYVRIGVDHFAKPTDDLARATREIDMHWNSLGYGRGEGLDIIGLGLSSSSKITAEYYFQNVYSMPDYKSAITNGKFPVYRGYKLGSDDIIRRDIIHRLRSYFFLDRRWIEKKYNINFKKYFEKEEAILGHFAKDGVLEPSGDTIRITEMGKDFISLVCRIFDGFRQKNIKV